MSSKIVWRRPPLRHLFDIRYGKMNPGRTGDVPVVGSSGTFAWTDVSLVNEPTIVVGRKGSAGRVWLIDRPCYPSDTAFYLVRKPGVVVDLEFISYALRAEAIQASDDVIPSLQRHELENKEVPLPEPTQQRAIANILHSIETAITTETAICDTLAALKTATMAKLLREGLRGEPVQESGVGPIPKSWNIVRLGEVSRITTGTTPATERSEYYGGGIPFVKTAEIDGRVILDTQVHLTDEAVEEYRLKLYPTGTVLLAMYGQGKTRGRSALLGVPATTTQNTAAIECSDRLVPLYAWHYLLSRYEDLRGMGNLGHLSHLNLSYVKDLLIPLPSIEEQTDIGKALDTLRCRSHIASERSSALGHLFRLTLDGLMTGAICTSDLNLSEVVHA